MNLLVGSSMFSFLQAAGLPDHSPGALLFTPLLFVAVHTWVQHRFVKRFPSPSRSRCAPTSGHQNARLAESLDGLQLVIKARQPGHREAERFDALVDDVKAAFVKQGSIEAQYLSNLPLPLAIVLGLVHSIYLFQLRRSTSANRRLLTG
ncbi:MAG: hypothetical protein IPK52_13485 [Chloroflexi bacterium]|nr:hypothetical protein [Chloroflexota bacterium]